MKRGVFPGVLVCLASFALFAPIVHGQVPATRQAPAASHGPKPQVTDVGTKYESYEEFIEALASWIADDKLIAKGKTPAYLGAPSPQQRYVMMTPPTGATGGDSYTNFIWVLDTQTGELNGYRFVSVKDPKTKEHIGWAIERVTSPTELAFYNQKTKDGGER
ncbi:MAG: hypothetical protein DMF84_28590 [Acidobacteria bacterium]|nr:MAG: hypothetical protein DMF84_28590 [Acidobacteriota bacterium]